MNNPIEIFYCWQAVVTALMVYMLTQALKSYVPLLYTPKTAKGKVVFKRGLMVTLPPILGFIVAALIPIHPETLISYVTEHASNKLDSVMIYGAWGAAVGQFADYLYTKVKGFIDDYVPAHRASIVPSSSDDESESQ